MTEVTISIRVASSLDHSAVSDLLMHSYPTLLAGAYSADILTAALPLMVKANPVLLASGTFYVAEMLMSSSTREESASGVMVGSDGECLVIGCGGWTREAPGGASGTGEFVSDESAHIRHFATHPHYIGRGVARKLMEKCVHEASRDGAKTLHCCSSLNAEMFYTRMGFKRVCEALVPMSSSVHFPCIMMEKFL